jgi:hypothetical protein
MAKQITNHWELLEAAFEAVDIYAEPQLFVEQFRRLSTKVGNLLAAHWCQSEVCNGGFLQFFRNSTGVLAPEAVAGFKAIGLAEWAALVEKAMSYFGSAYPRDREERAKLLPRPAEGQRRDDWDPFHELDRKFYEPLRISWEQSADAYATRADA